MTVHYTLTFMLLCVEAFVFLALIVPLPFKARRALFQFFGTNPIVGKILYGVKISIIFVSVLLVDAVQRLFRVMADRQAAKDQLGVRDTAHHDLLIKLAFAQRNCYLCGFTLFCSLILSRTYSLVNELIEAQTRLEQIQGSASAKGGAPSTDIATMKKQMEQQQKEYQRLADELAQAKGQTPSTKKD
ncbi:hypothetical protein FA10DRAFT_269637 [Acaromyces ingoldii]|uniref:Endoplasmic reticulum transmembrane protein n=1 Tax=Acaromyces ingoldii TaxID=215250 RepID=A0A316YCU7_9BASI|nr:hypothetical protein FA10DRAFT_269637 [Acaromyces ingoldii]PWN87039.1 hypothetical protein FA10DRAFT_269637 [Acaromyces ingoldii]